MRTILSIDPGNELSALLIYDLQNKKIKYRAILPNDEALSVVSRNDYDHLVIEQMKCYGMPVGDTVLMTCLWTGRFIQASGKAFTLLPRKTVASSLCGKSCASDSNVRQALLDLYSKEDLKGIVKDLWSALAIAYVFSSGKKIEENFLD